MKRFYQVIAVAVIAMSAPVALSIPASAASVCEVGFTGPNSQNMCVSVEKYSCDIQSETTVTINDLSQQEAASGSATVSGSGLGGGATSGSATNSNGTTYSLTIQNGASEGDPRICSATKIVPAKEVQEPTPGRGEVSNPVKPAQAAKPAALPVTSGDTVPMLVLVSSVMVTAGAIYAYRRFIS